MSKVTEELKKIDSQNYVMVLDIIELFTSCVQLSLCIVTKKKINFRQSIAWYTVFPRIVFATTILFWRLRVRQLFKGDNYSREETIDFLLFVCLYSLISSKLFSFQLKQIDSCFLTTVFPRIVSEETILF